VGGGVPVEVFLALVESFLADNELGQCIREDLEGGGQLYEFVAQYLGADSLSPLGVFP
jgi:hypothetical protein